MNESSLSAVVTEVWGSDKVSTHGAPKKDFSRKGAKENR